MSGATDSDYYGIPLRRTATVTPRSWQRTSVARRGQEHGWLGQTENPETEADLR